MILPTFIFFRLGKRNLLKKRCSSTPDRCPASASRYTSSPIYFLVITPLITNRALWHWLPRVWQGWSAVTDARRVQVCPFKDRESPGFTPMHLTTCSYLILSRSNNRDLLPSQTSRSCGLESAFSPWSGNCGGNPPVLLPPRWRCARGGRRASVWTCHTPPRTSANKRWIWITHVYLKTNKIFQVGEFQLTTFSYLIIIYHQVVLFRAESDCQLLQLSYFMRIYCSRPSLT